MNKLITIGHGINYWNAGDLGLYKAMADRLKEEIPNAKIVSLTLFNQKKSRTVDPACWDVTEFPYLFSYPKNLFETIFFFIISIKYFIVALLLRWSNFPLGILNLREKQIFEIILNSEVVISKPGGFIYDEGNHQFSLPPFIISLHIILLSIIMRKKTIIYAQSIGPFKRSYIKAIANSNK